MLEVRDLRTRYTLGEDEELDAVDGVSFEIGEGTVFGLVGESGCGKSTVAKSIIRTLSRNGSVVDGEIRFKGTDLLGASPAELRRIRWEEIALISQSAMNSLDPVYTAGEQIREAIRAHRDVDAEWMDARVQELFEVVGIDPGRAEDYPHQFSGGMKQRIMIAMSLVLDPDLIIADEPTTALDVVNQDTILHYLERLQEETGASILLITHDMGVVAEICDRVGVMYGGHLVEEGPTLDVFTDPIHPYTVGLKNSFPSLRGAADDLITIPGSPPDLRQIGSQCRFASRCPFAVERCHREEPSLAAYGPEHSAACFRIDELGEEIARRGAERRTWYDDAVDEVGEQP